MQDLVGIVRIESEMQQALDAISRLQGSARPRSASPATASTTPAGTRRSICANLLTVSRGDHARRRSSARKAAAATSATTIPEKDPEFGEFNIVVRKAAGWRDAGRAACRFPRCADELKQVIEEMK